MRKILSTIPSGILSLLLLALITYLSLASNPFDAKEMPMFDGEDKIVHALMYFGLAIVGMLDYAKFLLPHHTKLNKELAIMAGAAVYGWLMEVCQLIMQNGRSYDIHDWIADAIGAALAFLVYHFWAKKAFRHLMRRHHHHHHHKHHHAHDEDDAATAPIDAA